jgi:alkylated DNA nucleotide flippase Atl1
MAQMVEVMSVFAADKRLKQERVIPRPGELGTAQQQEQDRQERAANHGGLLAAATMRGKVVVSP